MLDFNPRAQIGGNMPPHLTALDAAQEFHMDCAILCVNSPETASQAALLIDRETKARNEAERQRKAEKEPYLEQGRKVDLDWKPVTETLQKAIEPVKRQVLAWTAQERARMQAEAEAARIEAERLQELAIEKMRKESHGIDEAIAVSDQAEIDAKTKLAEANARQRVEAEGIRARGIKTVWEAEIIDIEAVVIALSKNSEIQEVAKKVANSMARQMKGAFILNGAKPVSRETI